MLLIVFLFFQAGTTAQSQTVFPRLEPDPKALEFYRLGVRNSGFSWMELAEIALWASGDTSAANLESIRSAVTALNNSPELPPVGRERADFILTYLHRNILRSYSLYQTRVDTIFTNGSFNCVSSAVLYIIFCESAGIRTSAVVTRQHAFVMVHIDGQDIDVETTNRYGFEPGSRREFHDQFGRLTGFSHVPVQNYRDRQTINIIQLITLIFNNRIVEHERRNRFADGVPLSIDRAVLLFGDSLNTEQALTQEIFSDPRKDLVDRLLNYGASLLRANREEDSLRWAVSASSRYPAPDRWQEFFMAAVNNRIVRLLRDSRTDDARIFLDSNRTNLTEANFTQLDILIIDAALLGRANRFNTAEEGETIISDIEQARNSGKTDERRASELITFTVLRASTIFSAARDWRAAINYMENAIARFGTNRELDQALRNYRSNLATEYHNRFAAEWNKRNYEEAQRILNEGLAEFPDNRQLLNNMEIVRRHNSGR